MTFSVLLLVALFITCLYLYVKYLFSYWERRGVKFLKPSFPFGNFAKNFLQIQSQAELFQTFYQTCTEPFFGVYAIFKPILILRDPELIQTILIKDFQHFVDRGLYCNDTIDPLSGNLFLINSDKWKNLRVKLSPTFTSGKLKAMFSTLIDCSKSLTKYLEQSSNNNESVELRETSARYATNVIASVAFGADVDCFAKPDTAFRRYGRKVFELSLKNGMRIITASLCPSIMYLLKARLFDGEVADFMIAMVQRTLDEREKSNVVRKDFFQLLVQLRNTGSVQLDDQWETVITNNDNKKMSVEEMAAHAFVIF